jgi:hypothetical protein
VTDMGGYRIAVGGVALGLVMFLVGAAVIRATGHDVPVEYWSSGSAISGALFGILAPTPRTKATTATNAAARAEQHAKAAVRALALAPAQPAFVAVAAAHEAAATANAAAAKAAPKLTGIFPVVVLAIVFGVALWAGIEYNQTAFQSLAAAAGGALLGLLAPSPSTTT